MKISIIIVTYNSEEIIEEALSSIIEQAKTFEIDIIIVDNNSKDDTVKKTELFFKHQKIKHSLIINSRNAGYTKAVNQGMKHNQGDFFLLMNPDVVLLENFFVRILEPFEKYENLGAVAPKHIDTNGNIIKSCREFPNNFTVIYEITGLSSIFNKSDFNKWKMPYFDHQQEKFDCQPMGSCIIFPKKTVKKVGYMDERFFLFFNDVDYSRRILDANQRILFYPKAKIRHYKGHSIYKHRIKSIFYSHLDFCKYLSKYSKNIFENMINIPIFLLLMVSGFIRIIFHLIKKLLK